jgi:hypothetical protein
VLLYLRKRGYARAEEMLRTDARVSLEDATFEQSLEISMLPAIQRCAVQDGRWALGRYAGAPLAAHFGAG